MYWNNLKETNRVSIDQVPDKSKEPESKQFVGLVIGILTTVIVMLLAAIMFIFYRNRRLKAALAPSTFYDQHGDLKVSVSGSIQRISFDAG